MTDERRGTREANSMCRAARSRQGEDAGHRIESPSVALRVDSVEGVGCFARRKPRRRIAGPRNPKRTELKKRSQSSTFAGKS